MAYYVAWYIEHEGYQLDEYRTLKEAKEGYKRRLTDPYIDQRDVKLLKDVNNS